ncbi:hypothetical protein GCK72_006698 [Caenorhabditis remanei]|uniref:Uncharacterized protein n=1 Tax=Caenorhabditis remanei TaxID=31234 RepID=A0A6A5HFM7_CAERE|nr:hypothetical protein GCK72_006698 [Caenorhabditis remanei]KAF1766740.1 hypothetical protein GCK72_006698 [Caenorhabditis remanei]
MDHEPPLYWMLMFWMRLINDAPSQHQMLSCRRQNECSLDALRFPIDFNGILPWGPSILHFPIRFRFRWHYSPKTSLRYVLWSERKNNVDVVGREVSVLQIMKANNNRLYQIRKLRRSRRNDYREVAVIELKRGKALEEMEGLLRMEHDKEMEDTVEGNIRNQVAEYDEKINKMKNWVLEVLQIVSCFLCSKFTCP